MSPRYSPQLSNIFTVKSTMLLRMLMCVWAIWLTMAEYPCPVRPPCDCEIHGIYYYINCSSRGLTDVPNFSVSNGTNWTLYMNNNNIKGIPSRAFVNLTAMNSLSIKYNRLESIAIDALEGSESSLSNMDMSGNNFKSLPPVIGRMKELISLSIDNNPLQTLDGNVLRAINPTLQFFAFGSPEMTEWPTSLQSLTNVMDLTISNASFETLPTNAFLGFVDVESLIIQNCKIRNIPVSLNAMKGLQLLSLDSNPNLLLSGIPSQAFHGLSSLKTILIRNQSYATLPNIFNDAAVVDSLEVSLTPITHIPTSLIPDDMPMALLYLDDTKLNTIPDAVTKMKKMKYLSITNSNITSIYSFSFNGFNSLVSLDMSQSPLSDIADDAFVDMISLQWLYLDNTNINTIPKALFQLKNPSSFNEVSLKGNNVVCNCTNLGWLKSWEGAKTFQPVGTCANLHMNLKDYVVQEIPKCP